MKRRRRRKAQGSPPPPRSRWHIPNWGPLADGCLITLGIILFGVILGGLFIGWDYVDRLRYDRVFARVISVETSCLFERRSGGRTQTISRSEEFPCAEEAGRRAAGQRGELIPVLTVAYRYTSPRDGRSYPGRLHRDAVDFPPGVRPGGSMPVYSLKSDPTRSRGIYQWPVD